VTKSLRCGGMLACASFVALALTPAGLLAAPPDPEPEPSRASKRALVSGGVLIGLGFAAEISGTAISIGCTADQWCSAGFALTLGHPDGPNRYTMVSTGPSSTYLMGRIIATPLLISGFTLTMVGLASVDGRMSSWTDPRRRRLGWSLLGSGIGVLVGSTILRGAFLTTGTCQTPECVHGLDQATLWVGRGLTFAGAGILVQGAASRVELGMGGGPSGSFGLSFDGRF
jgi:hypothetical protein